MHQSALQVGLLLVAVVLLPFNVEIQIAEYGGFSDLQHRVSIFLFDIPLILLALLSVPALVRMEGSGRTRTLTWLFGALLILTIVAVAVHPSLRGLQVIVRLIVNVIAPVAIVLSLERRQAHHVGLAMCVAGALQIVIGLAQIARGETLGLTFLGENPPLTPFGGTVAAKGTFVHPYILAGFTLVAAGVALKMYATRKRRAWLVAAGVNLIGAIVTYSRMSVVALVGIVVTTVARPDLRRRIRPLAVLVLAVAVGAVLLTTSGAWVDKFKASFSGSPLDQITNQRVTFTEEALDLIRMEPALGVGPGRYVLAVEEELRPPGDTTEVLPVHNVPLLVAAESGIPAGAASLAILVWLGRIGWQRGAASFILYLTYLPFLLFDHFPYDNFQGLTITGLWIGFVTRDEGTR